MASSAVAVGRGSCTGGSSGAPAALTKAIARSPAAMPEAKVTSQIGRLSHHATGGK